MAFDLQGGNIPFRISLGDHSERFFPVHVHKVHKGHIGKTINFVCLNLRS